MKHISLLCASLLTTMSAFGLTVSDTPVFTGMIERNAPSQIKSGAFDLSVAPSTEYSGIPEMRDNFRRASNNAERLCKVKIVIDIDGIPDAKEFGIYKLCVFNDNSYVEFDAHREVLENNTWEVEVPAGTYDIFCGLQIITTSGIAKSVLIAHEDVDITADCEQIFKQSEADREIVFEKYLPNGEKLALAVPTADGYDDSKANALGVNFDQTFFHNRIGELMASYFISDYDTSMSRSLWINEMSDAYTYYEAGAITGKDGDTLYVLAGMVSGDMETKIKNDPTKWVKKEKDIFYHSPSRSLETEDKYNDIIEVASMCKNVSQGARFRFSCKRDAVNVMVCADADFDKPHIEPVILEGTDEYILFYDWDPDKTMGFSQGTYALPARYNGEKWEYVNKSSNESNTGPTNIHEGCEPIGYNGIWLYQYPGHPEFSYFRNDTPIEFGNSCPINHVILEKSVMGFVDNEPLFARMPRTAYIGRMGEKRTADSSFIDYSFSYNGTEVYNPSSDLNFSTWYQQEYFPNHQPGKASVTMTNSNILVDDMIGRNVTTLDFDERDEKAAVPTLTMLAFKNQQGDITDRFPSASDGRIELSAGSFATENYWMTCYRPEVTVEYSPMGTESWQPIDIEEIPDLYMMPNFGHFYRGNLEGVKTPTANGWYDLKISVTDSNGNSQIQTINPAFNITGNTGIESIDSDKTSGQTEYFTMQGIRVDTPTRGVYISRKGGRVSKIVIK